MRELSKKQGAGNEIVDREGRLVDRNEGPELAGGFFFHGAGRNLPICLGAWHRAACALKHYAMKHRAYILSAIAGGMVLL